ncbi:MAG: hypothetical protein WCG34_06185 [Leptolinea sp.]
MPMNGLDYLNHLGQERYRTFVLHAPPHKSAALTLFCQKLSQKVNCKYLDLLDLFIQDTSLSEHIDTFSPEELKKLLVAQSRGVPLIVLDRGDFLLDTWRKDERQVFYRLLNNQWDGFMEGMRARLLICLQSSPEIETLKFQDSQENSRIFQLADFNDIP